MKYLICLVGIAALIALAGCASENENESGAYSGRGAYGPGYYESQGSGNYEGRYHGLPPSYPAYPPENEFGPRRNFP